MKRSSAEKAFKPVGLKWWLSLLEGAREFMQDFLHHLSCLSWCYKGQVGHWSQREKDKCHREEEILRGSVFMKKKQVPDTERDTNRVWYLHAEDIPLLLHISNGRAFLWPKLSTHLKVLLDSADLFLSLLLLSLNQNMAPSSNFSYA